MKVLIVSSGTKNITSPFIIEQADSLKAIGVDIEFYSIQSKGVLGYLKSRKDLIIKINEFEPDLIHAHYGFSGLLANLQRKVPVITTYHGDDINDSVAYYFSKTAIVLSKHNIFVSTKLANKAKVRKKYTIRSCGVDLNNFDIIDRKKARTELNMDINKKYILFSSSYSNIGKNYPLAAESVDILKNRGVDVELLELKGYTRAQVNTLMNAVNCVIVTSHKESGPLVIKEAMAVNTCAVSVDVGDVKEVMNNKEGYFISTREPQDIADKLNEAIRFHGRTNAREHLKLNYNNIKIAEEIKDLYYDNI